LRDGVIESEAAEATEPSEVWWPAGLFQSEAGSAEAPIDVTGRARCLCWGPYAEMPAGRWRAEVSLEFCEDASRYDYFIEFGVLSRFSRALFRPAPGARTVVNLEFEAPEPWIAELRIHVLRPAFHGGLRLIGAHVNRIEPAAAADPG
jgi:hypothetical protein